MYSAKRRAKFLVVILVLSVILTALPVLSNAEKNTLDARARAALPGQFLSLPQGVVHYEMAGPEDAPLVVLVHGFSVPYYVWDPTFDTLTGAGFHVLRYDLYGRGYSDRPDVAYDLDLFTGQLAHLLSGLEVEGPVVLVGLSFGAPIVAHYAGQHPGQIAGLVLIDPQVQAVDTGDIFPLNLPLLGEYLMASYMAPHMLPRSQPDDFYRPDRFPDWEAKYRQQMAYKGFKRALLSTIRHMPEFDPLAEYHALARMDLPVMLIWGQEDLTVTAGQIAQLRAALPQTDFHPIPQAAHLSHYEAAEVVNPLLVDFLQTLANH